MRSALYALRDKLTNSYLPPFHATHDIAAVRGVVALLRDNKAKLEGNNVANYPAEYDLVRLCSFDDIEGVILTDATSVVLARCDKLTSDPRYFPDQPA